MVNPFYINRKIEIKPLCDEEYYLFSIKSFVDDKLYVIPVDNMLFNFSNKEEVEIKIAENDAIYLFKTTISYVKNQGSRYASYILEKPKQVQRVQNRKFVRIPVSINIIYTELTANEEKSNDEEGLALNLSGGGMRLATSRLLEVGSVLLLSYILDFDTEEVEIKVKGTVMCEYMRLDENSIKNWKHHYGISFINIPTNLQDLIMRYVIKQFSNKPIF